MCVSDFPVLKTEAFPIHIDLESSGVDVVWREHRPAPTANPAAAAAVSPYSHPISNIERYRDKDRDMRFYLTHLFNLCFLFFMVLFANIFIHFMITFVTTFKASIEKGTVSIRYCVRRNRFYD